MMVHHVCSTAVPGTLQNTGMCVITFRGHRAGPSLPDRVKSVEILLATEKSFEHSSDSH